MLPVYADNIVPRITVFMRRIIYNGQKFATLIKLINVFSGILKVRQCASYRNVIPNGKSNDCRIHSGNG